MVSLKVQLFVLVFCCFCTLTCKRTTQAQSKLHEMFNLADFFFSSRMALHLICLVQPAISWGQWKYTLDWWGPKRLLWKMCDCVSSSLVKGGCPLICDERGQNKPPALVFLRREVNEQPTHSLNHSSIFQLNSQRSHLLLAFPQNMSLCV